MSGPATTHLQGCLDRIRAGDDAARAELLQSATNRMTQLAHVMLKDFQRVRRWEETGDIVQNSLIRLHRALAAVTPPSVRDFYRLATTQIRRELIDLARHYYGPEGLGRRYQTNARDSDSKTPAPPAYDKPDSSNGPARLALWSEFHERVEDLPEEEREVFDLVWYQGLTHTEAANLLGVSAKTVKRRWQAACLELHARLGGELPG